LLTGQMILVERELLPKPEGREHYRDDLVGFEAKNLEGALLGKVDHFIDTPGNAVMVIKGEREHLVPVTTQHLRSVDVNARTLVVDWPEDF
jgi:16S rRNA processing protein RimM